MCSPVKPYFIYDANDKHVVMSSSVQGKALKSVEAAFPGHSHSLHKNKSNDFK